MDLGKIADYPDHPEPLTPAGEYEREAKPRVSPNAMAVWGALVLGLLVIPPVIFPKETGLFILFVLRLGGLGR